MYDQDDLPQLAFVARETLVELESENHFLHGVLIIQCIGPGDFDR
jgi:hypothetical protein